MNLTLNRTLANLGGSDSRENGLNKYMGLLSGTFVETLPAMSYAMRQSANGTVAHEFYAIGRAQARAYHPGQPNQGQKRPIREKRTVPADNAFIRSDEIVGDMDQFLSHIPEMARVTQMQAQAVNEAIEQRVLRMIALGARQPARVSLDDGSEGFDSGITIQVNAATVEAAFPLSLAGAQAVESALRRAQEQAQDRNLGNSGMRIAHISPYIEHVLMHNPAYSNTVIRAPIGNSTLEYKIYRVAGWDLVVNNLMSKDTARSAIPSAAAATIDEEPQYNVDARKTAILLQIHPESVGIADFQSPTGNVYRDEDRMANISRVTAFLGCKWLEPAACGEIYCDTSAYVEGAGGVLEPAS